MRIGRVVQWVFMVLFGCAVVAVMLPSLVCVAEGTPIETPGGPRPVEELRPGDAVLSVGPDGSVTEGRVVAVRKSTATRWRRLVTAGSRPLEVTGTHPIAVPGGWRPAGELQPGDRVRTPSGLVSLSAIDSRFGLIATFDLSVEPHENFIAAGVLVHNKRYASPEAGGVGDTRAVGSSEVAYSSSNGGFFGHLTCLSTPTSCGWAAGTTPFLDAQLASLRTKQGYVRSFVAGKPGQGKPDPGIETFVYVATPAKVGQTGNRGFAIDHTGLICFTTAGAPPPIVNRALDPDCTPLK